MKRLIKKSNLQEEIQKGDYVDFGSYGKLYVCNPEYQTEYYWVTDNEEERFNKDATGWAMMISNAQSIVEHAYELDEDYEDDEY